MSMDIIRRCLLPVLGLLWLPACTQGTAPVSDHSTGAEIVAVTPEKQVQDDKGAAAKSTVTSHLIKQGDTLYAIAWRYGLDARKLASWNGLRPPYTIYADKSLRLTPPATGSRPDKAVPSPPLAAQTATANNPIKWGWPLRDISRVNNSGKGKLLLAGVYGQTVRAAAPGTIVYSGAGIRGLGKLIIIQHSREFLSAYGHNSSLLVQEGEAVDSGQEIAKSGAPPGKAPVLYFEIRHRGEQVDTLSYLPRR